MYITTNQAPYLLRNRIDYDAEIKRRSAGYKNAEIITSFVRTEWTLHARSHISVLRTFLGCFIVIKFTHRVEMESNVKLHIMETRANIPILFLSRLNKKNCREWEKNLLDIIAHWRPDTNPIYNR